MRSLRGNSVFTALLAGWLAFGSTIVRAQSVKDLPWNRLGEELEDTRRPIGGKWSDERTWNARLCEGRYRYEAAANAVLTKVEFNLNEDGSLDAKARLVDIATNGSGRFRSWSTACVTLGGGFHARSAWAEVNVRVFFDESDEGFTKIRLRILRTELATIDFSDWLPNWVERLMTRALNRVLGWVWGSRLGAWLSEKIGGKVVELIPNPAP